MRPEILFPIFAPVTSLKGVGPRIAKLIEGIAGPHIVDLFWHLPNGLIDRRFAPRIADAPSGVIATITVDVLSHHPPPNRRLPYKITCEDETGRMSLVFFHARADYLNKILPEGETRVVSGKVERFNDEIQMAHPDHVGTPAERDKLQAVEPVYPLTQGLSLKVLSKAIGGALPLAPVLPEWLDPAFQKKHSWPAWRESLETLHSPETEDHLSPETPARSRLAYDELLANQLALALVRAHMRRMRGRSTTGTGVLRNKVLAALPWRLTNSQSQALDEITADMASDARMHRLLQGDVGSGKTVVALLSMLAAVEDGGQAVILAPTEILARQHLATIAPLAEAAGIQAEILTGREKGKNRDGILARLADGTASIAIGTHALIQTGVEFDNLTMAVIDEQHRFGVHQRLLLAEKGAAVDILVMTATPIPRTLMLTAYGDMEVSKLLEKPAGRQPIDTRTIPLSRLSEVAAAIRRALETDARIYWVCPLVEESEKIDLSAAEDRAEQLRRQFGDRVTLVHGRMKGAEKDRVMAAFAEGSARILVATTVIEVGVDVPEATIMVVEHAERFGLAQLHQLRGRIGRGDKPSTCLLLYGDGLTETARSRLKILRESEDGFRIAEEDLRLRGAGEVLGTRQSGLPEFRIADLAVHADLLAAARDDAQLILNRNPGLRDERGEALRTLLYLFERDAAVRFIRSG